MFIKVKTPWGKEWLINTAEILAVEVESASIYFSGAFSEGCNVLKVDADSLRRYQMYYVKCPYCGANLDPGEKCDCREEAQKKNSPRPKELSLNAVRQRVSADNNYIIADIRL